MPRAHRVHLTVSIFVLTFGLLLNRSAQAADADAPIRALFICGGCCHDYAKQKDIITEGISKRANVEWVIAFDPDRTTHHLNPVYENPDWFKGFDVIVHDECSADIKDLKIIDGILKPHRDGLPAVNLHCAMHCYRSEGWDPKKPAITPWFEFTGLATTGHGAQIPIAVTYLDKENPITKPLEDWTTIHEELYNNILGHIEPTATALAHGQQIVKEKDGTEKTVETTVVWTNMYMNKTRVFSTTLGHNDETCADPRYLDLVTRGLLWSVDKLDDAHLKPAEKTLFNPETEPAK
jgi:type 1 glutamine amidotransferase